MSEKRKTAVTIKEKYGNDFYQKIGSLGGQRKVTKGFGKATPEQRREWGRLGGSVSKKNNENVL
jgi:general stress protein YciG